MRESGGGGELAAKASAAAAAVLMPMWSCLQNVPECNAAVGEAFFDLLPDEPPDDCLRIAAT